MTPIVILGRRVPGRGIVGQGDGRACQQAPTRRGERDMADERYGFRARLAPVTLTLDGTNRSARLPLLPGTIGPAVADIRKLYGDLGIFTFDPGYGGTAACESKITYIDGDEGMLLHRGYPIEQLAEKSTFLEVAYLLLNGELPTAEQSARIRRTASSATPCCTSSCAASTTASAATRTRWR